MGLTTYQVTWSDDTTPVDPRINEVEGKHVYRFEAANEEDAMAVVKTFAAILPEHNFSNYELTTVIDEENAA